jgi:Tfp pilus assembly protein PilV
MTHRFFQKNEQGFVLLETLLALLILACALLLIAELWQASVQLERRASSQLLLSRRALSVLEGARVQPALQTGTSTQRVDGVTETTEISPDPASGMIRLLITYSWEEGGHSYVQRWAMLHR